MFLRSWILGIYLAVVLTICGCSDSAVVPVTGKVIFHSRELPEVCRLTFVPVEDSNASGPVRANGATMQPDGTYRMTPYQGVEGLLPGRYVVRVSYYDLKPGGNRDREADWIENTYEGSELVVEPGSGAIEHNVEVP